MTVKRPESVLVVLYDEYNHVLVLQRMDDAEFWQSVTGTMEGSEVPIQTAAREVQEETGINLAFSRHGKGGFLHHLMDCRLTNQYLIREDWRYRYAPGVTKNFEYVFCAQVPSQSKIILTEHTAFKWMSKQDAIAKVWSVTNKHAIERFVPEVSYA
ncbi:MAG: dATP pyrophosphohydrolase [Alphaproteobacteria bacterium]|jgi:dATP pyrophosphohydrolase